MWPANQSPYYKKRCKQLKDLFSTIENNLYLLKRNGHEKWNELDLKVEIGRWKPDKCAHPFYRENRKDDLYEDLKEMLE